MVSESTTMLVSPRRLVLCYAALAILGLVLMIVASKDASPAGVPDTFEKRQLVSTDADSGEESMMSLRGWPLLTGSGS